MKSLSLMLTALLLVIFAGCKESSKHDVTLAMTDQEEKRAYAADTTSPAGTNSPVQTQKPDDNVQAKNVDWDNKIIKTAALNLEVKEYNRYYPVLRTAVKKAGGYIAQEELNQSEYKIENTVSIKVPVGQFDEAINTIVHGTGHEKLIEKKVGSEDVTAQVVDTKARLESKRHARIRYMELLAKAKNMEEILQVQNEINELQEQMETASGRISYLNHSSAYSTINLTFYQILDPAASLNIEPSFFVKVSNAFISGWEFVKLLILGLIAFWPVLVLVAGLWFGLKKWKLSRVKSI